ncbi:MAG: serpin family protein [Ignavibacteria bacterium]|nr:serpin family protein [Ignavibacteria bacterium]
MKRILFFLYVFSLLLYSCVQNVTEVEKPIRPLNEVETRLISNSNDFAFKLFKEVNKENTGKNLFISPFSVSIALSMTLNGARGETFEEMQSTLSFENLTMEEINSAFKELFPMLRELDKNVQMDVANSIWCRKDVLFVTEFLETLRNYYDAKSETLDFTSPEAAKIINKWVEEKTKGKIKNMLESIPDYAVMYIINALYFKGVWKYPFDKSKTRDGDFAISENNFVKAKFMFQVRDFDCYFGDEFSALRLPYSKGNFSMMVILPKSEFHINDFVANFNRSKWETCLSNLRKTEEVTVYMPKFKIEFETSLKKVLTSLGMKLAFTDEADFSNLCRVLRCQITEVKHKTFVEVDEEGTEAAAATSVEIGYTAYKPAFYLNRPFVFVIYEKQTGAILFMGKLVNP